MKRAKIILEILCCTLMVLFFYTGISKLIDHTAFEFDLINAPIIQKVAPIVYAALPAFEIIVGLGLMFTKTRKISLYACLVLMVVFTIYVGGIMSFAKNKPCTCGGVLRSMSWPAHLIFNIAYTIVSIVALYLYKRINRNDLDYGSNGAEIRPVHAV